MMSEDWKDRYYSIRVPRGLSCTTPCMHRVIPAPRFKSDGWGFCFISPLLSFSPHFLSDLCRRSQIKSKRLETLLQKKRGMQFDMCLSIIKKAEAECEHFSEVYTPINFPLSSRSSVFNTDSHDYFHWRVALPDSNETPLKLNCGRMFWGDSPIRNLPEITNYTFSKPWYL